MLLVDALHINSGGGAVLLFYLMQEIEKSNINATFLLDKRLDGRSLPKVSGKIFFAQATFLNRLSFYCRYSSRYSTILCFGNLPPYIKTKAVVYTYFQQALFLKTPKDFSLTQKVLIWIKREIIKLNKRNTNLWISQNKNITAQMCSNLKISPDKVLIIPFYPPIINETDLKTTAREKHTYAYISNATPNKNHQRLINAFCRFYDKNHIGKLKLTVSNDFKDIKDIIDEKISLGYPIENYGFVSRTMLSTIYYSTEYLIFPSLSESLGLGIVEAIDCGCNVIGAALPYTYEACNPSLVFNPYKEESILEALEQTLSSKTIPQSESRISNKIKELIKLLIEE